MVIYNETITVIQVLFLYHYNIALSMLFHIYCVNTGVLVPQGLKTQVQVWKIQNSTNLFLKQACVTESTCVGSTVYLGAFQINFPVESNVL